MPETSSSLNISTKLQRIVTLAKKRPALTLTTLAHHIDEAWLREAYRLTRKDGAVGVDGVTGAMYAADLDSNLLALLNRFKSGSYRAPPVVRASIPKGDGRTRPIGIPAFEDKVLQRAVAMVLHAVYEQDFLPCSYGFRPGRSAHQALDDLRSWMFEQSVGWVLDVDIEGFFDALDHQYLRAFLDQRVTDGVIRRVIHKWLKAGVMVDGQWQRTREGTPQGGVISPLLANIYLHYVMDAWFEHEVKPRLRGAATLVRYADDMVMAFAREDDARRVLDVLPKRLGRFGLRLHPAKTRLVAFQRPSGPPSGSGTKPGSFDFLGFTHHWAKSRSANWVIKRKTARDRLSRSLRRINEWCRRHRHRPLADQQRRLNQMLRGHDNYFGITGNSRALAVFHGRVERIWHKWLLRRSHRTRRGWAWIKALSKRLPLLPPRIVRGPYRPAANP